MLIVLALYDAFMLRFSVFDGLVALDGFLVLRFSLVIRFGFYRFCGG